MQGAANDNFLWERIAYYVNEFLRRIIFYAKCAEENLNVFFMILILHVVLCISLYFTLTNIKRASKGALTTKEKILFVISHPDDECMFFGPAIVNLIKNENRNVFLLCLSYGKCTRYHVNCFRCANYYVTLFLYRRLLSTR